MADKIIDIHYQNPEWPIDLDHVGCSSFSLTLPLKLFDESECKDHIVSIDIFTNLPKSMRGSNLSRSIKSLFNIDNVCKNPWEFLNNLSREVLDIHEYSSQVKINLRVPIVTNNKNYSLKFSIKRLKTGNIRYVFGISMIGITACPSALAVSLQRINQKITHMQRAKLYLEVISSQPIEYRVIPDLLKDVFSGNPQAILGREDESLLIEKVFDKPLFTEDVARKALYVVSNYLRHKINSNTCIRVKARSYESIHNFDIVAGGSICW